MGTPVMRRSLLVLAVAGLALSWPAAAWGAPSAGAAATTTARLSPSPVRPSQFKLVPPQLPGHRSLGSSSSSLAAAAGPVGQTVPYSIITRNYPAGNPYQDDVVGGDPTLAGTGTTTLVTPIIPLQIAISGGSTVSDASTPMSDCGKSISATTATQDSPLFQNVTPDPENNMTQLIDAYERGNFNQETKPSGISPNYHLLFSPFIGSPVTVTVPAADIAKYTPPGCGHFYGIDETWWMSNFPSVVANLVNGGTITGHQMPLFVMYNAGLCNGALNCGSTGVVGGYHNYLNTSTTCYPPTCALPPRPVSEVYGVYDYDISGGLPSQDTAIMSHEVGEAINDPYITNPVPTWGHIGQQPGCQSNLEVGDPLSAGGIGSPSLVQDTYMLNSVSYTFHVQDLAYHSWFFREASPPSSVNVATTLGSGNYSMFGDLTGGSDSTVCPGQPTGLTAVPGNGSASFSWTAGPGPVDTYFIQVYQGGTLLGGVATTSTVFTVTGLTNGTNDTATVIALHANASGGCTLSSVHYDCSTTSLPSNSVTIGAPIAPTGVSASAVSGGAKVSWTAPANNNGSPVSGYVVTPFLNGVAETPDTFNSTATTETITGLTKGQHYTFTVAAINGNGTGLPSLQSNSVAPK
jgi:hypothetical protein